MEISDKTKVKNMIIGATRVYGQFLSGKNFLYVYGENYFEVSFPVDHFRHLTGVNSMTNAIDFYKDAKKGSLTNNQFYFDKHYRSDLASKKLSCLLRLSDLTSNLVCVLKDMKTDTYYYKMSLTDFKFTLGLVEDGAGVYVPMSLRVESKSFDRSLDGDIVDFIFSKDASIDKYDTLLVRDDNKDIPLSIKHLIEPKFYGD